MSIQELGFAEPFFGVKYLQNEAVYAIGKKSIVFNLSAQPVHVKYQLLGFFKSAVFTNMSILDAARCLVIDDFERYTDHEVPFEAIRKKWTLVYDATGVERHQGVHLWRSPKEKIGNTEVNMCFAASIPLNVGLHRTHWGDRPLIRSSGIFNPG
ncbi:MAG: hypothetical protein ABIJ86_14225 [Spirochaetota bacterium]